MDSPLTIAAFVVLRQPWWLAGIVLAAAPLLAARLRKARGRTIPTLSPALRCAATALAAIALAQPAMPVGLQARKPHAVLRDVSASARSQRELPLPWGDNLPRKIHHFASAVGGAGQAGPDNATNLAPALRLVLSNRDNLAGLVIHTDGQFTDQWRPAAEALGRGGIDVAIVPMGSPPRDARITELTALRRPDDKVDLTLSIASNSGGRRTVTLWRADRPDQPVLRSSELLLGPMTLRAEDDPPADMATVYHARLTPPDTFVENDSAEALVLPGRLRLALVASGAAPAVSAAAPRPVEPVAPETAPSTGTGWAKYSAVIVVDPTGSLLDLPRRQALAEYVRSGGSLVLIGAGPCGSAADSDDPLNRVAALVANPYERKPMKVTVVLDASGSMGQPTRGGPSPARKFDVAVEAVMSLRRHLTASDSLAVVTFSDEARRIYDSGSGPGDFAVLRDALAEVSPSGPTHLAPALQEAAREPAPRGRIGLVLLVSDLATRRFDPAAAARELQRAELSLAIVATGASAAGADIEILARRLGAPLKRRPDLAGLAEVFAEYLRKGRGEPVVRGHFDLRGEGIVFGEVPDALPDLTAYIGSAPQESSQVLLWARPAKSGAAGDPVVARRRAGMGRSVCLALPFGPGDNPSWASSPRGRRLMRAAIEWCLRPPNDPRFAGRLTRGGGRCRFRLDARDGPTPMNLLKPTLQLTTVADAPAQTIDLLQTALGRYEAKFDEPEEPFALTAARGGTILWRRAFAATVTREFARIGPNWENLHHLADLTGGRIISPARLRDLAPAWNQRRYRSIWPYLVALATLLMLADWTTTHMWKRRL